MRQSPTKAGATVKDKPLVGEQRKRHNPVGADGLTKHQRHYQKKKLAVCKLH